LKAVALAGFTFADQALDHCFQQTGDFDQDAKLVVFSARASIRAGPRRRMWSCRLLFEKMQPDCRIAFRFSFASGALQCYPWIALKKFCEARLAAGLSHLSLT
jgi:hypothetical protein